VRGKEGRGRQSKRVVWGGWEEKSEKVCKGNDRQREQNSKIHIRLESRVTSAEEERNKRLRTQLLQKNNTEMKNGSAGGKRRDIDVELRGRLTRPSTCRLTGLHADAGEGREVETKKEANTGGRKAREKEGKGRSVRRKEGAHKKKKKQTEARQNWVSASIIGTVSTH